MSAESMHFDTFSEALLFLLEKCSVFWLSNLDFKLEDSSAAICWYRLFKTDSQSDQSGSFSKSSCSSHFDLVTWITKRMNMAFVFFLSSAIDNKESYIADSVFIMLRKAIAEGFVICGKSKNVLILLKNIRYSLS